MAGARLNLPIRLAALWLVGGCGAGHFVPPPPPTDVPMTVGLYNDSLRFTVSVQVGNAPPFDALLDSGSAGLRMLPASVPDSALTELLTTQVGEVYGGSFEVVGRIARAPLTIGGLTTPEPIPIMQIDSFGCASADPKCNVAQELADHFSGFTAILGVGMRNSMAAPTIGNPIVQLAGQPAFIVQAPPFPGGAGTLRISPAVDEVAPYTLFPLPHDEAELKLTNGTPAWNDLMLPTCLDDQTSGAQYCAGALFDTGTPFIVVKLPSHSGEATMVPSGDALTIGIGATATAPPQLDYDFTVSAMPQQGADLVYVESTTAAEALNLGNALYFAYDVYYDQVKGEIGFLAK